MFRVDAVDGFVSGDDEEVFLDDVLIKHAGWLRRHTELSVRTDLQPTYVIGDPVALNEALAALIDHAFSNAVSVIDLAVYRHDAQAIITVGDDGPPASTDSQEGAPTGLDVATRIIAGAGGDLSIAERNPRGTTVRVRLPSTRQRPSSPAVK